MISLTITHTVRELEGMRSELSNITGTAINAVLQALLDKRPKSEEVVPSLAIESDIASALLSLTREVRFNAKNTAADDWPSDHDPNHGKLPLSSQQSVSTNRNSEPSRSSRISIAFLTHIDQPDASENRDGVQKVLSDQNTDRSDERAVSAFFT